MNGQFVTITINIEGQQPQIISVPYTPNMTAHAALEAAYNIVQNWQQYTFAVQYFGTYQQPSLGYFVVMFNSIYDAIDSGNYWAFYLNGTLAQWGIDQTILSPSDQLEFQQESYNETKHMGTPSQIKHEYYRQLSS